MRAPTPYDALGQYPDRSRPLVTHYEGADSRVELSVTSVINAVAKASSLLRDGLGLPPGSVVRVDLPRHWQLPIWVWAALSVGATVGRGMTGPADVRIIGPEGLAEISLGADLGADEVLASSCDAFGLPVPGGVPGGVIDLGIEVRAHPDQFSAEPEAGAAASLWVDGVAVPWARAGLDAHEVAGARMWVDEATSEHVLLRAVAVQPLLVRGSVVIGTGLSAVQAGRIRATESVTGLAGEGAPAGHGPRHGGILAP